MNTSIPRLIAKPLHSSTSLRVMLEGSLADSLRRLQQTHPALTVHGRHASFSLITRRALAMYVKHLDALPQSAVSEEQRTVLQLS